MCKGRKVGFRSNMYQIAEGNERFWHKRERDYRRLGDTLQLRITTHQRSLQDHVWTGRFTKKLQTNTDHKCFGAGISKSTAINCYQMKFQKAAESQTM